MMKPSTEIASLLYVLASLLIAITGKFLHSAYVNRNKVRALQAKGIPIATHSWVFGHLPIFGDFRKAHPPDINVHVFHKWFMKNFQTYFPGLDKLPPVVYLDLWPMGPCFALVYDPVGVSQFTQIKSLPKFYSIQGYIKPLTGNLDIVSAEGQFWRTWRSVFNPGFRSSNILTLLPEFIEDFVVFSDILKGLCGENNTWGPVFALKEKATKLTFDCICRVTLDMQFHQQTSEAPTPLFKCLHEQIELMNRRSNEVRGFFYRRMPWHQLEVMRNNRTMHHLIKPYISAKRSSVEDDVASRKSTVVGLAVKHLNNLSLSTSKAQLDEEAINVIIANIKAFLFAGQDTSAATICFMMKCLEDNPDCQSKMRHEHDVILGPNPDDAARVLKESPQLIYNLPYTLSVIKETLRLYPLAASARDAPTFEMSLKIPGSTTQYPLKGFTPWPAAPGIQENPDYWPDASKFMPERWMAVEGERLYPRKDAWMPFSLGPRNCIGMELAMTKLRLVCVFVARTFDLKQGWEEWDRVRGNKATPSHVVNGQRLYEVDTGPVQPKDGMPVQMRLRKRTSGL
ncbi:cytochrome P450 4V3 [Xylaria scruposa]|nr:cytochrome P450 4V3 [Xylaria scruposa]